MLPQDTKVFKTKILFAMASFIYSPVELYLHKNISPTITLMPKKQSYV